MADDGHDTMPWNFLGLPEALTRRERAAFWVLPVPYEATTSYGKGTANGPHAILEASRQVEWYDHRLGYEPCRRFGVHTLPVLDAGGRGSEAMVAHVAAVVESVLTGSPAPALLAILGGEHAISGGVARGLAAATRRDSRPPEGRDPAGGSLSGLSREAGASGSLVAVHLDAHADLRDTYEGTPHSHACAARRIAEVCPVFQVGIRNLSEEGDRFRRDSGRVHTVFAEEARAGREWLGDLAAFARGKTVYLTVDADGLDPSIMPAVGTPEPGGLSWETTLEVARTIVREAAAFPVFDVVELAPIPGLIAPDFLCAKLVYEVMCMVLGKR